MFGILERPRDTPIVKGICRWLYPVRAINSSSLCRVIRDHVLFWYHEVSWVRSCHLVNPSHASRASQGICPGCYSLVYCLPSLARLHLRCRPRRVVDVPPGFLIKCPRGWRHCYLPLAGARRFHVVVGLIHTSVTVLLQLEVCSLPAQFHTLQTTMWVYHPMLHCVVSPAQNQCV